MVRVASMGLGHHPTHQYGRDFSSVVAVVAATKVVVVVMLSVLSTAVEAVCTV